MLYDGDEQWDGDVIEKILLTISLYPVRRRIYDGFDLIFLARKELTTYSINYKLLKYQVLYFY